MAETINGRSASERDDSSKLIPIADYLPSGSLEPPPIPATANLRTFDGLTISIASVQNLEIFDGENLAANFCAFRLWISAFHSIPAGSLPNDDVKLARMSGLGTDTRKWQRYKDDALRGFRLHADGRLYHPVLTARVLECLGIQTQRRNAAVCGGMRRNAAKVVRENGSQQTQPIDKQENQSSNRSASVVQGIDSESYSDSSLQSESESPPAPQGELLPAAPASQGREDEKLAVELYNETARDLKLAKCMVLTKERRTKLRHRLDEIGGIEGWRKALAQIRRSRFLQGENDRAWKCDFTFLLQASSLARVLEGGYAMNRHVPKAFDLNSF